MRWIEWSLTVVLLGGMGGSAQSLATMAHQQRQRSAQPAAPRVYTNADLPRQGGISIIGSSPSPASAAPAKTPDVASMLARRSQQESLWRARFARARQRLTTDRARLDVSQKEYNLARMQYDSNPNVALREQYSQSDLKKRAARIEMLQKQIAADEKALGDLQDELRRQGLPPGWGRE